MQKYYDSIAGTKSFCHRDFVRYNQDVGLIEKNTPVLNNLSYWLSEGGVENDDIILHNYKMISNLILKNYGIEYIILYKKFLNDNPDEIKYGISMKNFVAVNKFIKDNIEIENTINDKDTLTYKVSENIYSNVYLNIGKNWYPVERDNEDVLTRIIDKNNATIIINNLDNIPHKIVFTYRAKSFQIHPSRQMDVFLNDEFLGIHTALSYFNDLGFPALTLKPGKNTIKFYIRDIDESQNNVIIKDIWYNQFE